ncbi:hypothetical protein GE09DRAFT_1287906 [Coniochaeta sp. 2T2.1]|nr:hypothetical protein GE09DRAFT_1287906 [Coniochaeta sp. 2T2.1]
MGTDNDRKGDENFFNEIITNTCCFLETDVDANGLEKHYARSTGKEVTFPSQPEVASVETPTRSTEEKRGWCCNRNCDTCGADSPPCGQDDLCHHLPVFHSPRMDTCCQLDSKSRLDGTLGFTTVSGEEVNFIDSEDTPSEPTLADRSTQPVSEVSTGTAGKKRLCCASDCSTCYDRDINCRTGSECHDVAGVDGPDTHTCCTVVTGLDGSRGEKLYTLGSGKEVKLLPSPTKEGSLPDPAVAIPSSDPPADPPRGWCCLSGCNACLHPPSCVSPDFICDRSALFNNCCMLERHKNQITGEEKYHAPITGEVVTFIDSAEEYLALSASVSDEEPVPTIEAPTPALAKRQAQGDLPSGFCCLPGCGLCYQKCSPPDYECHPTTPLFNRCCMAELRRDATGEEKYHNLITGVELKFVDEQDGSVA